MERVELEKLLAQMRQQRILVVGDVMLDRFLWGDSNRLSPEAPVPVVLVGRENRFIGGAGNVVRNIKPFAANVDLLGLVGTGAMADELRQIMAAAAISSDFLLADAAMSTIVKTRIVARGQQVLRVDRELDRRQVPDLSAAARDIFQKIISAQKLDAVIIQDYNKGFLRQSLVDEIIRCCRQKSIRVYVDLHPDNQLDFSGADLIKPNRSEALKLAGISDFHGRIDEKTLCQVAEILIKKWQVENLLITLGEQGMALAQRDATEKITLTQFPAKAAEVFDVSGAGDTAIALFALAHSAGASMPQAALIANLASSIVVGKLGTAIISPDELLETRLRS